MTAHLVLDIETIPDPDLPQPPPTEKNPDPFPAPPCHQIVEIGVAWMEPRKRPHIAALSEAGDERAMLAKLIDVLDNRKPTVVTWNGRHFDMPVIAMRAMRHGLTMGWWYAARDTRYRYSAAGHYDVSDFLTDFGASGRSSLDVVAKMIGLPGKMGVDGNSVAAMEAEGRHSEVSAYCLHDVVQTAGVMLRAELLRGGMTLDEYQAHVDLLLDACARDERFAAFTAAIDMGRFRLGTATPAEPDVKEVA